MQNILKLLLSMATSIVALDQLSADGENEKRSRTDN